jgi:hypothetical protein
VTGTEAIVAAMEREWPRWQVWTVHKVVGGTTWCARRWDDETQVLNAGSADELVERLVEAAAGNEDDD